MKAYKLEIRSTAREYSIGAIESIQQATKYLKAVRQSDLLELSGFSNSVFDYQEITVQNAKKFIQSARSQFKGGRQYITLTYKKLDIRVEEPFDGVNVSIHTAVTRAYGRIKESIRQRRADSKRLYARQVTRYINNERVIVSKIGSLLVEGEMARIQSARRARLAFTAKSPRTNDKHIGIELEFTAKAGREKLGLALVEAGVGQYVHLKGDGSIRILKEGHEAHELTACIPEHLRDSVIDRIVEVLKKHGASVNKSCGFHVHLDMRHRNREQSFSNLVTAQNVFYAMQPKSRQTNTYCAKTRTKDFHRERNGSRYKGVNATAYSKYNTIEIRMHAGTVDAYKIKEWVTLLIAVADATPVFKRAPRTLDSFCKGFGLTAQTKAYITDRIRKFGAPVETLTGEDSDVS